MGQFVAVGQLSGPSVAGVATATAQSANDLRCCFSLFLSAPLHSCFSPLPFVLTALPPGCMVFVLICIHMFKKWLLLFKMYLKDKSVINL